MELISLNLNSLKFHSIGKKVLSICFCRKLQQYQNKFDWEMLCPWIWVAWSFWSLIFNSFQSLVFYKFKIELALSGHSTEKEFFVAHTLGQFMKVWIWFSMIILAYKFSDQTSNFSEHLCRVHIDGISQRKGQGFISCFWRECWIYGLLQFIEI